MPPPPCGICDEEGSVYDADIEGTETTLCSSCGKRLLDEVEDYLSSAA